MEVSTTNQAAQAAATRADGILTVRVGGRWRITAPVPDWAGVAGAAPPRLVRVVAENLDGWDSALVLFLTAAIRWSAERGAPLDLDAVPAAACRLARQAAGAPAAGLASSETPVGAVVAIGLFTQHLAGQVRDIARFVGDCTLGILALAKHPRKFRWRDCTDEMQHCGAMALPIVGLISFLVGLIMAFQAAVQLRQFGADIFVADLVGLAVVREMGPMMAAVVVAGRTGAAFAATLGNMKVGEEIDALETFGIAGIDFLVLPRLVALFVMMPLLALYADALGILGGMVVSALVLNIPVRADWIETQSIVGLSDLGSGLIKSAAFGLLIGLAGCWRGLQCERSAAGIGRATTSAVVTGILFIIVADALFAVIFNILGL